MGRPTSNSADWFQHYVNGSPEERKLLYILEERYGNDGYAAWYKLKELLVGSDGHYLDINEPEEMLSFVAAKFHIDEVTMHRILDLLAKLNAIDAKLWGDGRIWSQLVVDSLWKLYASRKREPPPKPPRKSGFFESNDSALEFLPRKHGERGVSP